MQKHSIKHVQNNSTLKNDFPSGILIGLVNPLSLCPPINKGAVSSNDISDVAEMFVVHQLFF